MEALPLFEKHNKEIDLFGRELELDIDRYIQLNELGYYKFFTAREDGELIGYQAFFIATHAHHKTSVQATQDVLYYKEEKRGKGLPFMAYCELELKKQGIEFVLIGVPASNNWSPILKRKGFKELETIYVKEI